MAMDSLEQSALTEALDRMWRQFSPQMHERLALIQTGVLAYANGELSAVQKESARDAAHKLSGVLGTFGLANGTVLARELETIFACLEGQDQELAERMVRLADGLNELIENRK